MAYDIYGNDLRRGHCEVHPHIQQEYPCYICCVEIEKSNNQNRNQYHQGNPEQFDQNTEWTRVVIDMLIAKIPKSDLDSGLVDIDFNGNYMIQIKKEDSSDLWTITNAMNGYGQNCFEEFKEVEVLFLSN